MESNPLLSRARPFGFVLLSAAVVVVGSEKVFWYVQGFGGATGFLELTLFYSLAVMVALWLLAWGRADGLAGVVLAGAALGWIVEGVITTVVYEDGPLPVLAAYFVGWHGLLSLVGLWYLLHKWLVEGRRRTVAVAAACFGVFWGLWSLTYWVPQATEDLVGEGFDLGVWPASKFAAYAFVFGGVLGLAHWLLGMVWPAEYRPTRRWTVAVAAVLLLLLGVTVVPVVPWGPFKLAVLLGVAAWATSLSRRPDSGRSVFERLVGAVAPADAALVLLAPAMASLTYWAATLVRPTEEAILAGHWVVVATTAGGGAAAFVLAVRSNLRRRRATQLVPASR